MEGPSHVARIGSWRLVDEAAQVSGGDWQRRTTDELGSGQIKERGRLIASGGRADDDRGRVYSWRSLSRRHALASGWWLTAQAGECDPFNECPLGQHKDDRDRYQDDGGGSHQSRPVDDVQTKEVEQPDLQGVFLGR
jgi:hypothetical protein